MPDQFISEPLRPVGGFDASRMAAGEPGVPIRFVWRDREYAVETIVREWKELSTDGYVRKHWYEVRTDGGCSMKIYFERQGRGKGGRGVRWWLFTLREDAGEKPGEPSR